MSRDVNGRFIAGKPPSNRCPVGTVRIRTRHKRGNERRAFIKVGEPNKWELLARYRWEQAHGPLQRGMIVHHKDENTLNDEIDNLELTTRAKHMAIHRDRYDHVARLANSAKARRAMRWSTKSATKRVGRPPRYSESALAQAKQAIDDGMSPHVAGGRFSVSRTTLYRYAKARR